jgi:hypothetical protein
VNILDNYQTCRCPTCADLLWWEVFMEDRVMSEYWKEKDNDWFFRDL